MVYQTWPPEIVALFRPPTFRLITYVENTRIDSFGNTRTDSFGNTRVTKEVA